MARVRTVQVPAAYAAAFENRVAEAEEPVWLRAVRRQAFDRFLDSGFPTVHDEEWRYTDPAPIAALQVPTTPQPARLDLDATWMRAHGIAVGPGPSMAFVNGARTDLLPRAGTVPPGVHVTSWAETLQSNPASVRAFFADDAAPKRNAFTDLNAAMATDGAAVDVDDGVILEAPIHLVHVASGAAEIAQAHPRNVVRIGARARATLVETFVGDGPNSTFTNAHTRIDVGPEAVVEHYKIGREAETALHAGSLDVRQQRASKFTSHSLAFGGALVRNDLAVRFEGEGAECTLNGLYVLHGTQHVDHHTSVDHAKPHCTSREFYKGILDDRSRGVFYGKVFIRKDAQKSVASQTNKNLLLSDGALVDSTPALEINADDVKAQHGSTIGQLDKDALFYLRARGLGLETARGLLTYGFAREVLARVRLPDVRAKLDDILFARLPNGPSVREALHDIEA